jgi:hypothetical protein
VDVQTQRSIVFVGMVLLAKVLVESQHEFEIKWNLEKCAELSISKNDVEAALRSSFGSAASRIAWG